MFYALLIVCSINPCTLDHAILAEQSPHSFKTEESCYSSTDQYARRRINLDDDTFPPGGKYTYLITCESVGLPL